MFRESGNAILGRMAKGLETFDSFAWGSLLRNRTALVCERDRARALTLAQAVEEAGATATLAPSQPLAADRALRQRFCLAIIALAEDETLLPALEKALAASRSTVVLLADEARRPALLARHPAARIACPTIGARDLVMLVTGSADE